MGDRMKSIWNESVEFEEYDELKNDFTTDVLIIGGGLVGLLTGYLLKENEIEATIIEAKKICSGQTKNTTAKITSQHGIIYSKIEKYYGFEFAKQYARANENAIAEYERIINKSNIKCNFEKSSAYLYSNDNTKNILNEMDIAKRCGIKCHFESDLGIPIITTGAIAFENQAQFHPLRFARDISKGLKIYENTPAIRIEGNTVITPNAKITASKIVVACHYPFINFPSQFFLRMSQERSYVIALENANTKLRGMYIGESEISLSFRQYKDYILLGSKNHRTGLAPDQDCFDALKMEAHKLFPNSKIVSQWSAQDCITIDGLPYIGKFNDDNNDIFIATGFNKWGMTSSMVSARIITDMICNNQNENSEVFSPSRFSISASILSILDNSIETIKSFSSHLLPPINTAMEIKYNGKKAGAYTDSTGTTYIVSLVCPHLKCKLNWNNTTKTWDCPCHGSRFNYKGDLIDNPAQQKSVLIATKKKS